MNRTTLAILIASFSGTLLAEPVEKAYVDSEIERISGYTHQLAEGQTYLGIRDGEQQTQIDYLDGNQAAQQDQLNNHDTAIANQQSTLDQHGDTLSNHQTQLTAQGTTQANQQTQLNQHDTTLTNHQAQIAAQGGVQAAQQTQLNQQGTTQQQQGETLTNHGQQLTQHNSQLSTYGERLDGYDQQIVDMDSRFTAKWDALQAANHRQDKHIEEAMDMGAAAYAAAALQFCTQQDCGLQIAGGAATLNGKQALAFGVGGAVTEKLFINLNVVNSGSVRGGAVGATYSLK